MQEFCESVDNCKKYVVECVPVGNPTLKIAYFRKIGRLFAFSNPNYLVYP